jgi:two-component sensor histidine kinase
MSKEQTEAQTTCLLEKVLQAEQNHRLGNNLQQALPA